MSTSLAVAIATTFTWTGLVLGISFIEAPLKFRAPGVTVSLGLGIGRLVFKVVNSVEVVIAVVIAGALVAGIHATVATVALTVSTGILAVQLVLVRPRLSRRSDAVLAGEDVPRSAAHHVFITLETAKLAALLTGGIAALYSV